MNAHADVDISYSGEHSSFSLHGCLESEGEETAELLSLCGAYWVEEFCVEDEY